MALASAPVPMSADGSLEDRVRVMEGKMELLEKWERQTWRALNAFYDDWGDEISSEALVEKITATNQQVKQLQEVVGKLQAENVSLKNEIAGMKEAAQHWQTKRALSAMAYFKRRMWFKPRKSSLKKKQDHEDKT